MPLVELTLRAGEAIAEQVADRLSEEFGALSVSLEDGAAGTPAEQALFGEPGLPAPAGAWADSTIRALFDDETQADRAAAGLLASGDLPALALVSIATVDDQDWVRLTQQQFEPVEVTPTFWIVPTWHSPPPGARTVIRLDPGLAFGTGSHATTRMCLRWIAAQPAALWRGARVLDYGCGSGILAIAAALHGAPQVDAVDIDAAAVEAARRNAQAHGVDLRTGEPGIAQGHYRVVLANILATPLKLLAPLLARLVQPGGHLVLAGLLDRQIEELQAAYAGWGRLEAVDQEDGWSLLAGRAGTTGA